MAEENNSTEFGPAGGPNTRSATAAAPGQAGAAKGGAGWRGLWLGGGIAVVLLIFAGGLWIMDNPSSLLYKAFLATAELSLPAEGRESDEFLVFLAEDSQANRAALYATSPNITYVADSLLPRVVVVKIPEQAEQIMAALREHEFVSLVMRYNPSFGCH